MKQIYGYNNAITSPQATKYLYYFIPAFCLTLINVIMFVYICKIVIYVHSTKLFTKI
jgi:hypothetical protein